MSVQRTLLETPRSTWVAYLFTYCIIGFIMNAVGTELEIARFANWWQVLTCYGLYLVPCSLVVRHLSFKDQYLTGLVFLGLLELAGYSLGTSIPYENNLLDQLFTERNFALVMTLFFASYLPLGNLLMAKLFALSYSDGARDSNSLRRTSSQS